MNNYNEMDMRQTSQFEDEEQEIDGMNVYCLIGMICSILGTLMMFLTLNFIIGLVIGIVGVTLSAVGLYIHNRSRKNLAGKALGKVGIIVPLAAIVLHLVLFANVLNQYGSVNGMYEDMLNNFSEKSGLEIYNESPTVSDLTNQQLLEY